MIQSYLILIFEMELRNKSLSMKCFRSQRFYPKDLGPQACASNCYNLRKRSLFLYERETVQ